MQTTYLFIQTEIYDYMYIILYFILIKVLPDQIIQY
jgi:hypothetical protein